MPAFLVLELGPSYSLQSYSCTWEGARYNKPAWRFDNYFDEYIEKRPGVTIGKRILSNKIDFSLFRVAPSIEYRLVDSMEGEKTPKDTPELELHRFWRITLIFFPAWGSLVNGCCLLHSLALIQPGAATMSANILDGEYVYPLLSTKVHRGCWKT